MAQIGTYDVKIAGSVVQIPVYDPADVTNDYLRVPTASGVGAVALTTDLAGATHPYLRVQTGSGVMAVDEVSTSTAGLVDSFEDQNITEYGGATSSFSIVTSPTPPDGSYALKAAPAQSSFETISSTTGLNTYPSAGDTFRCRVYVGGAHIPSIYYFTQSEISDPNGYRVEVNSNGPSFLLKLNGTNIASDFNITPPTSEWLDVEVATTTGGNHTATLFNSSGTQLTQISATDSTYSSGGVGFGQYDGDSAPVSYFDHYRIL